MGRSFVPAAASPGLRFLTHRFLCLVLVALACATGLASPSATASTALRAQHSGKCVDVPARSTDNEVTIIQFTCHGGAHQQFEFVPTSDGYYNVRATHSGKCLNVQYGSTRREASIIQYDCSAGRSANDQWLPEAIGDGYRFRARHTDMCLNVYGGFRTNNTRLIQWPCVGAANEIFALDVSQIATAPDIDPPPEPEPGPEPEPTTPETGTVYGTGSLMLRHSGKCVNVPGASQSRGVTVIQWTCEGYPHDQFRLEEIADGVYHIIAEHSGMCLNVEGGSRQNLAPIIQWPCTSSVTGNDAFRLQPVRNGYRIVAQHSGLCMNLEGGTASNSARLIQYTCSGTDNEVFDIGAMGPNRGAWSSPVRFPLVPVASGLLPDGNVLAWSAFGRMNFGGDRGYTLTALYNPVTGTVSERQVSETGHDMFCPGTAQLADGRFMVTGGSSSGRTSIYEPDTERWTRAADMNRPRAYHSSVTLGDGSVMVVGGSWGGGIGDKGAEVFRDGNWDLLDNVSTLPMVGNDPRGLYRSDNHMWLFAWTGDRVFHAGPSRKMHMISTDGEGTLTSVGTRGSDSYAMNGSAVMFEPGRILTSGGAPAYDNGTATTRLSIVDINGSSVRTSQGPAMRRARAFHHSVVLPNGQVFIVGGQEKSIPFDDTRSVLMPELYDPASNTLTTLAPMAIPRTYHSVAMLMKDGRVFVGGGGLCGGCETNHPDAEIFTPPYLLDFSGAERQRPDIVSAPATASYGETIAVTTNQDIDSFSLVRVASSTHSVNTDQRRIPLTPVRLAYDRYELTLPVESGVAPPGIYMLFAIDEAGTPSEASMVRISE